MSVFFTCIILLGSGLVVFALLWMLAEKRRLYDYREDVKERKEDLIKVIEDAETLIEEMNRFSDYVVTTLEQSHEGLQQTIAAADRRIELLDGQTAMKDIVMTKSPAADASHEDPMKEDEPAKPAIIDLELFKRGKVIPFDVKRREILNLAKSGMDAAQIAKLLNMGRGEIELISRMSR